jgi:hypothetical protein
MSLICVHTPTWLGGIMPSIFNDSYADQLSEANWLMSLPLPALSWRGGRSVAEPVATRMPIGGASITGEAQ